MVTLSPKKLAIPYEVKFLVYRLDCRIQSPDMAFLAWLNMCARACDFLARGGCRSCVLCRPQEDADRSMGWHVLPPLTWHAFLWQEPNKPRAIEVAFAGVLSNSHGGAKHSEVNTMAIKGGPHEKHKHIPCTRTSCPNSHMVPQYFMRYGVALCSVQVYSLDKIGESESLGEKEASITRSVLTLVATGMRVKR